MRWINILAALCAATGIAGLAAGTHMHHLLSVEDAERVRLVSMLQVAIAALALALTPRTDRLSLIAAALLLAGVASFAGAIDILAWLHSRQFVMGAPIGGVLMILGAVLIMFTKPAAKS